MEVKVKITLQKKENLSVNQNFFNVEDLILLHGFDICQEIQYTGIATLQGGGDSRVISFTIKKSAIDSVMLGDMTGDTMRDWVEDLILLHGFDICQEIQYTGIATLQGGGDSRVISFTIKKSAIDSVMLGDMTGDTMRDWVEDLWISNNLGT